MTSDNFDTYIKIIYTANVKAQLSIFFLFVMQKRVELQVYDIQRRQFRLFERCLHHFHTISRFIL